MKDIDNLIQTYAATLQDIYETRTAGDYTFSGVLFRFLMEMAESNPTPDDEPKTMTPTVIKDADGDYWAETAEPGTFELFGDNRDAAFRSVGKGYSGKALDYINRHYGPTSTLDWR